MIIFKMYSHMNIHVLVLHKLILAYVKFCIQKKSMKHEKWAMSRNWDQGPQVYKQIYYFWYLLEGIH